MCVRPRPPRGGHSCRGHHRASMGLLGVSGYCVRVTCCGLSLRIATLWIARSCAVVGVGLIVLSSLSIDSMHRHLGAYLSSYWTQLFYIPLGFGLFQLCTSLLLACGVLWRKQLLFIPWLLLYSLQTALVFVACAGAAVVLSTRVIPLPFGYLPFVLGVIYAEVFSHLVAVVLSHCQEVRNGAHTPEDVAAVV